MIVFPLITYSLFTFHYSLFTIHFSPLLLPSLIALTDALCPEKCNIRGKLCPEKCDFAGVNYNFPDISNQKAKNGCHVTAVFLLFRVCAAVDFPRGRVDFHSVTVPRAARICSGRIERCVIRRGRLANCVRMGVCVHVRRERIIYSSLRIFCTRLSRCRRRRRALRLRQ